MQFFELPERLNYHHIGTFSPLLVRFEGGNDQAGFCIEEYREARPFVSLYGDLKQIKECWAKSFDRLKLLVTTSLNDPAVIEYHKLSREWFILDCRLPDYRITIHEGPTAIPGAIRSKTKTDMHLQQGSKADLRAALDRMEAVYRRFYNV